MSASNSIFFWLAIWLSLFSLHDSVKIGISKPLATTTTLAPNTTVEESTTNELATDPTSVSTAATAVTTTTTAEPEWPEFPPKKKTTVKPTTTTTTTTTKKPMTTTRKSKTITTTAVPTMVASNNVNNKTENALESLALSTSVAINTKYCFCDLSYNSCDINCCCDVDCSPEAVRVFQCLKENTHDFQIHEGRFEDFKFQHGLPSCEVNDGWLCVFRTNIPPVVEKVPASYSDTSHYHKWPNMLKEDIEIESRDFYIYGDILKIINIDTREVKNFDLPSSLKPPQCQGKEPIIHLKTHKLTCMLSTKTQLEDIKENFIELQEKFKISTKPTTTEDIFNSKELNNYIGNITTRWCNESSQECKNIDWEYNEDTTIGGGALRKVQVNVIHNFTNIHGIIIDLWLTEITEDNNEFWLDYKVVFSNKTLKEFKSQQRSLLSRNKAKIISGPLGYQLGKPLIISRYVPVNESLPLSEKNQIMAYFANDNVEQNTLTSFRKQLGLCKRLSSLEDHISYGINLAKQCKIRMNNNTLLMEDPLKVNFTSICLNLQDIIHQQLWGDDLNLMHISSYYVSQLGKPQNYSNKWLPLNVYNSDFNPIFGQYLENSYGFICRNILLNLNYEFHIASYDMLEMGQQNLVKHASLIMGDRHDLEFALDEVIEVPLTLTVRFFDINVMAASASSKLLIYCTIYVISLVISL